MHEWYNSVCDQCKEYIGLVVNTNYHTTFAYHQKNSMLISAFLQKHYGHKLRLIHLDDELDQMHEQGYSRVDRQDEDFQKLYMVENNSMLTLPLIESLFEKQGQL